MHTSIDVKVMFVTQFLNENGIVFLKYYLKISTVAKCVMAN